MILSINILAILIFNKEKNATVEEIQPIYCREGPNLLLPVSETWSEKSLNGNCLLGLCMTLLWY